MAESNATREDIHCILTDHHWRALAPHVLKSWNRRLGWVFGGITRRIARRLDIDSGIGWVKPVEQACSCLTTNDVDLILASGPPFAAFKLAKFLSDRFCCPYVLDYRDPWTENPHGSRRHQKGVFRREAQLLSTAAAVTIVSPSWAESMRRRFDVSSNIHVVTNGYDLNEVRAVKPFHFGHFAIVYAGNFYPPKRVVTPLMAVLQRLNSSAVPVSEWRFHYYGGQERHVREEARQHGLMDRLVLHGSVPRRQVLSATRGANVAVVITSTANEDSERERGIVPGKIFETVGLRTPILLIAPPSSDATSIIEAGGFGRSFSGTQIDAMTSFLISRMCGSVSKAKDSEDYTWSSIGERLDSILRTALTRRRGNGRER